MATGQKECFDYITSEVQKALDTKEDTSDLADPVIITVSGGPGTGKTFTMDKVMQQLIHMGFMVLITATTAAAALRYKTQSNMGPPRTIHSAAQLPIRGQAFVPMATNLIAEDINPLATSKGALEAAQVIVVDEMSMLTITLLYVLLSRLRQATKKGHLVRSYFGRGSRTTTTGMFPQATYYRNLM
jgi:ATP-dependent exoDNAse (exonuclease V) alpha subunit